MRSVYATATATATAVISTVIAVGKRASNNNNYFNFVDSLNSSFRSSSLRCCCRRHHHHRYIIPSIVTKVGRKGRIRLQNFQTINNNTTPSKSLIIMRSPATTLFKSTGLMSSLQTQPPPSLLRRMKFGSITTTSTATTKLKCFRPSTATSSSTSGSNTNAVGRGGMLVGIISVFAIGAIAAATTRILSDTDNDRNNIDKNNGPEYNDVDQHDHSTTILPPPRLLVMPSTTSDILLFDAGDYNDDDNKHEQYYEKDHQFHYHAQKKFPFLFYLLKQVKVIKYSEKRDSISITSSSGRNKPTGLVGLACIHCYCLNNNNNKTVEQQLSPLQPYGQAIFPQDRRSLAREVKIDLYNHVLNCECCPIKIKQELQQRYCKQQQQQQQQQNVERQQLSSSLLLSSSEKQKNKKKRTPIISKEERLFFKKLWFRMGHKEHLQE